MGTQNISWLTSYSEALNKAKSEGKLLLIDFFVPT